MGEADRGPSDTSTSSETPRRTIVLGLGNPILTDDAFGLRVAECLRGLLRETPVAGVDVATSMRAGFDLVDVLGGYERAVIVDCLVVPDPHPGRVRWLALDEFQGSARLTGAHDVDVRTAFELGQALGRSMPPTVDILAVEAADTETFSETMTEAVALRVEPVARQIYALLRGERVDRAGS